MGEGRMMGNDNMLFDKVIGIETLDKNKKRNNRVAVRAIIYKDNKILMVKNNRGDYKLPGGGVHKNEDLIHALRREVAEETGYKVKRTSKRIGHITERHKDTYMPDTIFEMKSEYYFCEVYDNPGKQNLDPYEEEQDFRPVWIELKEAIEKNEEILEIGTENTWVTREVYVLKILREYFEKRCN